jgi:hypothetical protein
MEKENKEKEQNKYLDWFVRKPYKAGVWTGRKAETGTKYAGATAAAVPLPIGSFAAGTIVGFFKNLAKDLSWFNRFFESKKPKTKPNKRSEFLTKGERERMAGGFLSIAVVLVFVSVFAGLLGWGDWWKSMILSVVLFFVACAISPSDEPKKKKRKKADKK